VRSLLRGTRSKKVRTATWLIVLGAMSTVCVHADVIFSNFGAGDSFQSPPGWTIGGPPSQVITSSFETSASIEFADAQIALFSVGGTTANVYLETNSAGNPGAIIDTLTETGPISSSTGSIVTFDCTLCPVLSASTEYWIVVTWR